MNILQLSKHMNDSGVNSHIIELSRLLTMYGHRVIVVSSGGTHVKELEKHNIKHYTIPLDTKNPLIQIKNIFLIIKIIKKEKIEIAHTHWRSTGILIKLASIFTGINFVWTNHLNNIPSNFLYRLFTFYGKYAITVSSDMVPLLNQKLNIPMNKIRIV
ncbi:glycosyltransferase family 4 protein [Thermoanaerobacterium thermosaccharolyticum]|nr:glycosyltransferase family 4 protein [Thermoanaerobacterium thermosaccharolyticum]MBE0229410.1 glycosyltransferase family 4 protein [Thermoanaerobacterium thermosaccharolyticum]